MRQADIAPAIERAAEALACATYAVALVGAGISVESGIPPFRGAGGLWTKHGEPSMDGYRRFLEDPEAYWRERMSADSEFTRALEAARPNAGHVALARLEQMGVLKHTITQNIDNLHVLAGSVAVTEIHGNRTKLRCIACGRRWPRDEFAIVTLPPACPDCGGIVKSDTVMFGEPIPDAAIRTCYAHAERADCMLIAGTSAAVTPAAWFPGIVLERLGVLIEVNPEETPFSEYAISVRAPAGVALPLLAERVAAAEL